MLQRTNDIDPIETAEWREAFQSVVALYGPERAGFLLDQLVVMAHQAHISWSPQLVTPYVNTIPVDSQQPYPGDLAIEEKLASLMRWNALAMVARANAAYGELGGHIASYASAADLFEVGFNHFFNARHAGHGGDLVFFQPHSAPRRVCTGLPGRSVERKRFDPLPPRVERGPSWGAWPLQLPPSLVDA